MNEPASRSDLVIRGERPDEYRAIESLIRDAFWDIYRPGCVEHLVVHRLREDSSFVPELSLVAVLDGQRVGAIVYSKAKIELQGGGELELLVLGPVAVLPAFQKRGIGEALICRSRQLAAQLGYSVIALYGDPSYYGRSGFVPASQYGITDSEGNECPALLALELKASALSKASGRLLDNPIFFVSDEEVADFDAGFSKREKHALPTQLFLGNGKIRPILPADLDTVYGVVNDAAQAYKGKIPAECWKEPYMPHEELEWECSDGVEFVGYFVNGLLVGVMGRQSRGDVFLIRHAYVSTACHRKGVGTQLMEYLLKECHKTVLVGTWRAATWAISFYEKAGFRMVEDLNRKNELLKKYWKISQDQTDASVVLYKEGDSEKIC